MNFVLPALIGAFVILIALRQPIKWLLEKWASSDGEQTDRKLAAAIEREKRLLQDEDSASHSQRHRQ